MRYISLNRFLSVACFACLSLSLAGCEEKPEAAGPEMGSIEAYLEENPDQRVDDEDEAGSEDDEFDAGS